MLEAVKYSDGRSLLYASEELRRDPDFILEAVNLSNHLAHPNKQSLLVTCRRRWRQHDKHRRTSVARKAGTGAVWDQCVEYSYTDCRRFQIMQKGGHFAAFEQPTLLVDEGVTSYDFDTVKLVGTTALGFAPVNSGASTVTVSIRTGAGDRSSTRKITMHTSR